MTAFDASAPRETFALQRLELSRSAGDARVGDDIRYPTGEVSRVVDVIRKRTLADGRTLLWIYQDWGKGSRLGRHIYWDNDQLRQGGEIVPSGMRNAPALRPTEPLEKWAH